MDNSPIVDIIKMAELAQNVLKNLQSGEGFGLDEEQKKTYIEHIKTTGHKAKVDNALVDLKTKMEEFNKEISKATTPTANGNN